MDILFNFIASDNWRTHNQEVFPQSYTGFHTTRYLGNCWVLWHGCKQTKISWCITTSWFSSPARGKRFMTAPVSKNISKAFSNYNAIFYISTCNLRITNFFHMSDWFISKDLTRAIRAIVVLIFKINFMFYQNDFLGEIAWFSQKKLWNSGGASLVWLIHAVWARLSHLHQIIFCSKVQKYLVNDKWDTSCSKKDMKLVNVLTRKLWAVQT